MKSIAVLLCVFPLYAALAQQNGYDAQQNVNALGGSSNLVRVYDSRYEGIKGSPFFPDYWCEGTIYFNDARKPVSTFVKYDVYKNQLVARRPQGDSVLVNTAHVSHFQLKASVPGIEYLFKKFPAVKTDDPRLREEYFQVVHEGKTALLIKRDKTLLKASYQGGYSAGRTYDELVDDVAYYLKKPDLTLQKIRLNKKALLEALADKQSAVKKFIEQEKTDWKDENSVKKLLEYYDTL